jgi:FixJ family two-component response regulator
MDKQSSPECRVFILDDDDAVRESVSQFLELNGFAVEGFSAPDAFLDAYDGGPGHLLLDVHLGRGDGLQFARRALLGKLPLSVVIMTGSADPEKRQLARQLGTAGLLLKPFSAESLLAALAEAAPAEQGVSIG